jgi:hypothetical protein
MSIERKKSHSVFLLVLLFAYAAASLIHYVHNAVFLDEYPNMPDWLSPARVYVAWCGVTAIGIVGYMFVRRGLPIIGLILLAVYGALGLDGLGHYSLAPISAHSIGMNLTIWLEALTATTVLTGVAGLTLSRLRGV